MSRTSYISRVCRVELCQEQGIFLESVEYSCVKDKVGIFIESVEYSCVKYKVYLFLESVESKVCIVQDKVWKR